MWSAEQRVDHEAVCLSQFTRLWRSILNAGTPQGKLTVPDIIWSMSRDLQMVAAQSCLITRARRWNPSPGFVVLEGNRSGHADDGVRRFPRGKQAELVRFEHP
jgi:hypothetical protein